jgi:putative peptidoglycan lipid II flippase
MSKKRLTTAQLAVMLSLVAAISKLLGFARELILANYFGAGMVTDAYTMSLSIPNNLLSMIVTAAMTAYIPIFSQKVEKSAEEGNRFTSQVANFLLLATATVAVLGGIFARQLVSLFAPGFTGEVAELTVFYTRFAFLMVVFSVFANVFGAYLEYKGAFIAQQVFNYTQNILIIAFIIISAKTGIPQLLIFGITLGYMVMGLGKFYLAAREGYRYKPDFHFSESVKDVMVLAVPVFIGSSLIEINIFIDRILASGLGEGIVSALNYGMLFANVVSSFTVAILVTILYPRLAQAFTFNEYDKVSDIMDKGINLIVLIMTPIMIGSMIYSSQIVQVVYERGAFTEEATKLTATAYFYYSIAVVFTGVRLLLDKVCFAMQDTKIPVLCSVVAVCTNIILNLILVRVMGHAGLALATSVSGIVATCMLYIMFGKKYPNIALLKSFKKTGLIVLFSALSCAISYAFYYFVGNAVWMPRMVLLGLAVLAAIVVYFILLYAAKFEELDYLADLVKFK